MRPDRPMIVAVDFDGTIVEHAFPEIGKPMPGVFEVLKELKQLGIALILNTCREDLPQSGEFPPRQFLSEAVEFCRGNGIEFDGINETPAHLEFRPNGGRKAYADLYIDDRNFGGFEGWQSTRMVAWIKSLRLLNQ